MTYSEQDERDMLEFARQLDIDIPTDAEMETIDRRIANLPDNEATRAIKGLLGA